MTQLLRSLFDPQPGHSAKCSATLDLCYVPRGRIDGFKEPKLKPWDVAAGSLIVAEAGGKLSDFRGEPFDIRGRRTLAPYPLIREQM